MERGSRWRYCDAARNVAHLRRKPLSRGQSVQDSGQDRFGPVGGAIARQDLNRIVDAFYPLQVGEDFLSDLLEISGWADSREEPTPRPCRRRERRQVWSAA